MNIKQLFADDRAVSPVIGVILMVAITVILAAVIGTFVLGLGSGLNQAPQVQMDFQFTENASEEGYNVQVVHQGGQELTANSISAAASEGSDISITGTNSPYTAGSVIVDNSNNSVVPSETVQIVWASPDGSSSQIIGESTAPSN
ncbi:type IV pilin [Candidatus Halobonum tyrrellensis]|uniref:Archaeal Type IV pilin N-terminal domain-containing protein n=1 Tax=Candidatus Halobonum tyrrellensis G22 TaxID=1324957 RepID=V4HCM0_9EURY|nr:type IV pilin N-terminal domain-containing protein [Candidatus Halobonum tyrrellensis]ESP87788.1 hypothetical protein K933_12366 [Candidatus Halobonum tyrrellensis G22]